MFYCYKDTRSDTWWFWELFFSILKLSSFAVCWKVYGVSLCHQVLASESIAMHYTINCFSTPGNSAHNGREFRFPSFLKYPLKLVGSLTKEISFSLAAALLTGYTSPLKFIEDENQPVLLIMHFHNLWEKIFHPYRQVICPAERLYLLSKWHCSLKEKRNTEMNDPASRLFHWLYLEILN